MTKKGWIKMYRKSMDNFLYQEKRPLTRREAWEDILLLVNQAEGNVLLGNMMVTVYPGQSVMSLNSWAQHFRWSKSKVKRFFDLLQKCEMIRIENVSKTTRLTVCNWESYQGERNDDETMMKRQRNDDETMMTYKQEYKECIYNPPPKVPPPVRGDSRRETAVGGKELSQTSGGIGTGRVLGKITDRMINPILKAYPHQGRIGNEKSNRRECAEAISRIAREQDVTLEDAVSYLEKRAAAFAVSDAGQRGSRFTPRASTWFRDERYYENEDQWELTDPDKKPTNGLLTWEQAYDAGYTKQDLEIVGDVKDEHGRPKVRPKKVGVE